VYSLWVYNVVHLIESGTSIQLGLSYFALEGLRKILAWLHYSEFDGEVLYESNHKLTAQKAAA